MMSISRARAFIARLPAVPVLIAALAILYSGWITYVVILDKPLDFYLYYLAAYGFAHGIDIYGMGRDYGGVNRALWAQLAKEVQITNYAPPYRYPPLTAELVWPLTLFHPRWAALIWLVGTALAFIASAWLLGHSSETPLGVPLALGSLLFFVPPLTTLHAGQINGFLLLALAFALYAFARGRPVWTGVGVAVGTMLKLVPITHLVYLGWRRQWQAMLIGLMVIICFFGLALPLMGWQGLVSYGYNFLSLGQTGTLFPTGANQSFNGFFARLLAPGSEQWQLARWLWLSASLVLMMATAALCWPTGDLSSLFRLEFALVTTAISLLTPYVWYHQLALLLIPFFVLAERALTRPSLHLMLIPLTIGYVLTDIHGLAWHHLEFSSLLVSMPFYTTLMLWWLLAWLIVQEKRKGLTRRSMT
jgi:hypothetical protein